MKPPRSSLHLVHAVACLSLLGCWAANAPAQDIIGEAIGKVITPMIGPVLERAAVEGSAELLKRRYENGRRNPGQGIVPPRRQVQPPRTGNRQPSYSGRQPTPSRTVAPADAGSSILENESPSVDVPDNKLTTWPVPKANVSPTDLSLTHVVSGGPEIIGQVIRKEAKSIADQLGRDATNDKDPSVASVIAAATAIGDLPPAAKLQEVVASIEALREQLTTLSAGSLPGEQLAVVAQRVKNLKNVAVTTEIARVLGVQRRSDLFEKLAQAGDKSKAPRSIMNALAGLPFGDSLDALPQMDLPPGIPTTLIYNPAENGTDIKFVCDETLPLTLAPGDVVAFDVPFVLAFENGAGETKKYSIKGGVFRWVVEDQRWDIRLRQQVRFTLDASLSTVPFRYQLNGEPQVLDAGSKVAHESSEPPRIDFDLGLGDGRVASKLMPPGDYLIGINSDHGGWDILDSQRDRQLSGAEAIAHESLDKSVTAVLFGEEASPEDATVNALLDALE